MSQRTATRHPGIYQYETKAGERRYGVVFDREPDWRTGKRNQARKEGFTSLKDARAFQTAQHERRRRGDAVTYSLEPVGAYLRQWIDSRATELRGNTIRCYLRAATWLDPIAHVPLSRLTTGQIESVYRGYVQHGGAPSTLRICHAILGGAMKQALRHNLIASNPCTGVRLPRLNPSTKTAWTYEQAVRFLGSEGDDGEWGLIWTVFLNLWLRPGELMELRWKDVDLERRTLTISRTVTRTREDTRIAGPAKTGKSHRTIPLSVSLVERLRQHRHEQRVLWLQLGRPWAEETLVFPNSLNRWHTNNAINFALADACQRADVPVLHAHELRHTGASVAYANGVPITVLSERMGHSDVSVTLGVYTHTDEDQHRKATEQIEALFSV